MRQRAGGELTIILKSGDRIDGVLKGSTAEEIDHRCGQLTATASQVASIKRDCLDRQRQSATLPACPALSLVGPIRCSYSGVVRFARILITILIICGVARGQSLLPHKDMVFAHVAAGESIESRITLSNRGTRLYSGILYLVKNQGESWNATVNGVPLTKGRIPVSIAPGATITLVITGTQTETGFALLVGSDMTQPNSVDGNLTFFVRSGSAILDSVGVQESSEIYFCSIPFDNFPTVAVALANIDSEERATDVLVALFTENGTRVGAKTVKLGPFWHRAFFLKELFPEINMVGKGRAEIQSEIAICGTALNVVEGQISSLPVMPAARVYTLRATTSDGSSFSGEANLWAEGFYVKGCMVVTEAGGVRIPPEPFLVYGRLIRGVLRLSFYAKGKLFQDREVVVYTLYRDFSFAANSLSGSFVATYVNEHQISTGTLWMTKTN